MCSSNLACTTLAVFLVGGLANGVIACAPIVRVRPYVPGHGERVNGAVYQLPQALLQTDFTLKLTLRPAPTCAATAASCAKLELAEADSTLDQVKLDTIAIPDPAAAFIIRSAGSFMMKTTFNANFSEKGELTSSQATTADQSLGFATWGLETLAKVAKAFATAGETPELTRRHENAKQRVALDAVMAKLDERIVSLASGELPLALATPADKSPQTSAASTGNATPAAAGASTEIDKILALKGKLRTEIAALDAELCKTVSVPVTCLLDPSSKSAFKISEAEGDCPAYPAVRAALAAAEIDVKAPLPELTVTLYELAGRPSAASNGKDAGAKAAPAASIGAKAEEISGFVYRIPAWFRVEVISERRSQIQKIVAIPQRGQLAVFALDDGDLRAGKTVEVSLHPSLGMLKQVKLNGEPINLSSAGKTVNAAASLAP